MYFPQQIMGFLLRAVVSVLLASQLFSGLCLAQDGEWSAKAEACIRNNNHWVGTADSFEACQRSCERQTSFRCLSVDYNEDGRCQHSRYHRTSIRPTTDFSQPCYNGNPWFWAERLDIEYQWTDVVLGCIRLNNDWDGSASSIEDCQQRCIDEQNFVCLSIDYKESTNDCHLSRFNSASIRPTSDYTQPCYAGSDVWRYSERRDKKYYWTDTVLGCIRNHNDWDGVVSSLKACQKRCVEETDFTCLSIDYFESSKRCHLSRFNRNTLSPTTDFTQPCYVDNWKYAERVDVGEWTPEEYACIRDNNIRSSVRVPDLASCKLICSQDDRCCSVDYKDGKCNLSGKNRATVDPASYYTEPCYVSGYQYTERVDKFCGYR